MMVVNKFWWNLMMLLYSGSLFSQEALTPLHWQAMLISPQVQQHKSPFSVAVNPSALAFFQQSSWGIAAEKRFYLPGWIQGNGVGILSTKSGNLGIAGEISGLEGFSRQQLNISYARSFSEKAALGLSLGLRAYNATGYKTIVQPIASVGTCLEISNELNMGFSASAVFPVNEKKELLGNLNLQLLVHLQYAPSSKMIFSLWGAKNKNFPIEIGSTLRYQFEEKLSLQAGVCLDRHHSWLGISIARKKIIMNLQLGWHPMLGVGSNFSLYGSSQ